MGTRRNNAPGCATNEGLFEGGVRTIPTQPVADRMPKVQVEPLRSPTAVVIRLMELIKKFDAYESAIVASRPSESILRAKILEYAEAKEALRAAIALIQEKKS